MMAESYSFHFLNKEGQLIMIVHMRCADDQAALAAMPQSGPWADIEICSGDGRVLNAQSADAGQKMRPANEHHPDH
jgi:hypothetical protein